MNEIQNNWIMCENRYRFFNKPYRNMYRKE